MEGVTKNKALYVASMMAWVIGGFALLFGFLGMRPDLKDPTTGVLDLTPVVIFLVSGAAFCFVGFGLRKQKKAAGIVGLVSSGLLLIRMLTRLAETSPFPLLVFIVLVILILVNWKELS